MREFDDALHMMEVQGGSFVKALAHLYYMADSTNKPRVRDAFPEYFGRYEQLFQQHKAAREAEKKAAT